MKICPWKLTIFRQTLERQKCSCKPGVADYHKNNEWDEDGWDCRIIPPNEIDPKEVVYIQMEPLRKVLLDFDSRNCGFSLQNVIAWIYFLKIIKVCSQTGKITPGCHVILIKKVSR